MAVDACEPEPGTIEWTKWEARQRGMIAPGLPGGDEFWFLPVVDAEPGTEEWSWKVVAELALHSEEIRASLLAGETRGMALLKRRRLRRPRPSKRVPLCLADAERRAMAFLRGNRDAARARARSGGPRGIMRRPAGRRSSGARDRSSTGRDGPSDPPSPGSTTAGLATIRPR